MNQIIFSFSFVRLCHNYCLLLILYVVVTTIIRSNVVVEINLFLVYFFVLFLYRNKRNKTNLTIFTYYLPLPLSHLTLFSKTKSIYNFYVFCVVVVLN